MRWVHLAVTVLFAIAKLFFALHNLTSVAVSFLGLSLGAPLGILVFVAHVPGGSPFALPGRSYAGSRRRPEFSS